MKFEWSVFHSKVARRVFYLFVVSALIPVIFLAVFQITQMSRQLSESSQLQVRQSVKTIGMDLIGRLFHLENQLNLLGQALNNMPSDVTQERLANLVKLAPDFNALTVVAEGKITKSLKGRRLQMPKQMGSIAIGQTSVSVISNPHQSHVIFVNRVNANTILLGQVRNIWHFDIHSNAILWVIGPDDKVIFSSKPIEHPKQLIPYVKYRASDVFSWAFGKQNYYVGYWSLFLKQRLQSDDWVVVIAEPQASVLSQSKGIYTIFIPTIIFALLLTMLLSQAQISRLLVPLESLRRATRRIARRDFSTPVQVHSGDEFEELGHAFNTMAKRLNRQFKALSILSTLDQSILSQKDGESVLKIIFEELKAVVQYDVLVLGIIGQKEETVISLMIDDPTQDQIQIEEETLSNAAYNELKNAKEIKYDLSKQSLPSYLKSLTGHPINYFFLFPISHRSKPTALIGLGFKSKKLLEEFNEEELQDIFFRASIAFTHAEWEKRLYKQAHYDDLTKLPNRLLLRDKMGHALKRSKEKNTYCVLMFVDLDNFKDVNDTLGHSIGDLFLEMVANRMQKQLGSAGLLARIGGDEFTVFISDIPSVHIAKQKAEEAAKALLKSFDEPFFLQDMEYFATASVGISIYPSEAKTSEELLKFADMSMYLAKEKGKNLYAFYSSHLKEAVMERNQLIQDMYRALHEDEFQVYFQPKINCKNNQINGAEALIRWQHPEKGLLMPDSFLPLAEESNLIYSIGDKVIKKVCLQMKQWKEEGVEVPPIAINLAARQFMQKQLGNRITKIINKTGVEPHLIEFEVTENAFLNSFQEANIILNQLKDLGCNITLDDFGTGYSSMLYLIKLPLDTIKIDQAFVKSLPQDSKNLSIVKAIKALAYNLNLKIVAEGVETKEQSDILMSMGCEIQQGFYFSKALTADAFKKAYLL